MALVGAAILVTAVPTGASAKVRTGSVTDSRGDAAALGGPALDLQSIAVRYDDAAGTLRVTWIYYDDIRAAIATSDAIHGQLGVMAPVGMDWGNVTWSSSSSGGLEPKRVLSSNLSVSGAAGSLAGATSLSEDGHVVTSEFSSPLLVGRDWQQSLGMSSGADPYAGFWFDGYGASVAPPVAPPITGGTPPPIAGSNDGASVGMTVNGGAQFTNDPNVTLSIVAPVGVNSLRVANDGGFRDARTFAVASSIRWRLAESGAERLPKTVYLRFGAATQTFTDDIILDQTKPTVTSATLAGVPRASAAQAASKTRTYRVRVRAKDAVSGVAKLQFAGPGRRQPSTLRNFATIVRWRATRAPAYVRVRDRAGNLSRWRAIR